MRNIDRVDQGQFATPLTQPYLAEALGLTADHLNRVVRQFSKNGIFELGRGQVKVFDLAALTEIAGFDPSYLTSVCRSPAIGALQFGLSIYLCARVDPC